MINEKNVKKFCKEDPSLIENYDKAIADTKHTWHCHHRLGAVISKQYLIDHGLYEYRPAAELIFLTMHDHRVLHTSGKFSVMYGRKGKDSPSYGKNPEDYMTPEAIKEKRRKQSLGNKGKVRTEEHKKNYSESRKGNKNPMFGKHYKWVTNYKTRKYIPVDEIGTYFAKGYVFGMSIL